MPGRIVRYPMPMLETVHRRFSPEVTTVIRFPAGRTDFSNRKLDARLALRLRSRVKNSDIINRVVDFCKVCQEYFPTVYLIHISSKGTFSPNERQRRWVFLLVACFYGFYNFAENLSSFCGTLCSIHSMLESVHSESIRFSPEVMTAVQFPANQCDFSNRKLGVRFTLVCAFSSKKSVHFKSCTLEKECYQFN